MSFPPTRYLPPLLLRMLQSISAFNSFLNYRTLGCHGSLRPGDGAQTPCQKEVSCLFIGLCLLVFIFRGGKQFLEKNLC